MWSQGVLHSLELGLDSLALSLTSLLVVMIGFSVFHAGLEPEAPPGWVEAGQQLLYSEEGAVVESGPVLGSTPPRHDTGAAPSGPAPGFERVVLKPCGSCHELTGSVCTEPPAFPRAGLSSSCLAGVPSGSSGQLFTVLWSPGDKSNCTFLHHTSLYIVQ